jgi:hypothetical protein
MTRHGAAGFFRVWRSRPSSAGDLRPRAGGISRPAPCLPGHPRLEHGPTKGPKTARHGAWRGGRVVECTALEMRHRCKPIGGSNPSLSATSPNPIRGLLLRRNPQERHFRLAKVGKCRSLYPPNPQSSPPRQWDIIPHVYSNVRGSRGRTKRSGLSLRRGRSVRLPEDGLARPVHRRRRLSHRRR